MRPEVESLFVADPPEAWEALGFSVDGSGCCAVGGVRLRLGCSGRGIVGWSLRGPVGGDDLDGLETTVSEEPPPAAVSHPLGVVAVDHVVALTDDLDRTTAKLSAAGLDFRRVREAGGGHRQAFFVVGPCLLELGGPAEGPPRFWGLTLVVSDLDAAAERLGARLGRVKPAVQRGRRIATLRREAGLSVPVALMTPR